MFWNGALTIALLHRHEVARAAPRDDADGLVHAFKTLKSVLDDLTHAGTRIDTPALATWVAKAVEEYPLGGCGSGNVLLAVQVLERILGGDDASQLDEDGATPLEDGRTEQLQPPSGDAAAAAAAVPSDTAPAQHKDSSIGAADASPTTALSPAHAPLPKGVDTVMQDTLVVQGVDALRDDGIASTPQGVADTTMQRVPIDELDQSDAEAEVGAVLEGSIPLPRPVKVGRV